MAGRKVREIVKIKKKTGTNNTPMVTEGPCFNSWSDRDELGYHPAPLQPKGVGALPAL